MGKTIRAAFLALAIAAVGTPSVLAQQDRDCPSFRWQEDAQAFFNAAGPGDPHGLDDDNDGVACEDLPRRGTAGDGDGDGTMPDSSTDAPSQAPSSNALLAVIAALGAVGLALRRRVS